MWLYVVKNCLKNIIFFQALSGCGVGFFFGPKFPPITVPPLEYKLDLHFDLEKLLRDLEKQPLEFNCGATILVRVETWNRNREFDDILRQRNRALTLQPQLLEHETRNSEFDNILRLSNRALTLLPQLREEMPRRITSNMTKASKSS